MTIRHTAARRRALRPGSVRLVQRRSALRGTVMAIAGTAPVI